jgi:hypothetical protein
MLRRRCAQQQAGDLIRTPADVHERSTIEDGDLDAFGAHEERASHAHGAESPMSCERIGIERGNAAQRPAVIALAHPRICRFPQPDERASVTEGGFDVNVEIPYRITHRIEPVHTTDLVLGIFAFLEPYEAREPAVFLCREAMGLHPEPARDDVGRTRKLLDQRIGRIDEAYDDARRSTARDCRLVGHRLRDEIVAMNHAAPGARKGNAPCRRPEHGVDDADAANCLLEGIQPGRGNEWRFYHPIGERT